MGEYRPRRSALGRPVLGRHEHGNWDVEKCLQHMPPHLAKGYIRDFLRVLRPSGVVIFQVPSECSWKSAKPFVGTAINALPPRLREEVYRRRRARDPRNLPMHSIPRTVVLRFVERAGGRVIACIDDGAGGPDWRSFHYIVRAAPASTRRERPWASLAPAGRKG